MSGPWTTRTTAALPPSANSDIASGVEDLKAAVVEYLADLELKFGDQVPTGLPNGDRQFVILPGMAHSVVLGVNRQHFWHAMHAFLTLDVEARATQPRA